MNKIIFLIGFLFLILIPLNSVHAQTYSQSFITVVNPVRGDEFWDLKDGKPQDALLGQISLSEKYSVPMTWMARFDALHDPVLLKILQDQSSKNEVGLFLEVTPTWARSADVTYHQTASWHLAGSIFLTGYIPSDRIKLIDAAFSEFKNDFGYYPKSVGSWWIDSYSLSYMQKKYGITSSIIVADQFTTDNYKIWGQYWEAPYYPNSQNIQLPAQNNEHKIPVVITQWAARDPVNGYGEGVEESTYSVQVNDYVDYHNLGSDYFSKLVDIYTNQPLNKLNFLMVGMENTYSWQRYQKEYENQIQVLAQKRNVGQFNIVKQKDFASLYMQRFPDISPSQVISAKDPLGSDQRSVWYSTPFYRAGWFYNNQGSLFRDLRPYIEGDKEPCDDRACETLEITPKITRVLDDISHGQRLVLDQGKISDFNLKSVDNYVSLTYKNAAGTEKEIKFLPHDISLDNINRTIDGVILLSQNQQSAIKNPISLNSGLPFNKLVFLRDSIANIFKFLIFIVLAALIPGILISQNLEKDLSEKVLIGLILGLVELTLISFVSGYLKLPILVYLYIIVCTAIFLWKNYKKIRLSYISFPKLDIVLWVVILGGVFFQTLMMFKTGGQYSFGIGFWGPLGHDGIWHQALVNQLIKSVPPQNPGFANTTLSNYHYFYDLLIAQTYKLTLIPVMDLVYRIYPIIFSLLIGFGSYKFVKNVTKSRLAALISIYIVYFAGSFGWIVEYIHEKHWGGESAFWANQPVSINLNPPFAISVLILISLILVIQKNKKNWATVLSISILGGSLIEFKVYAGILFLIGLFTLSALKLLKKDFFFMQTFVFTLLISLGVFLPQNSSSSELLIFSPFWFVNSMIDYPDRVGWIKLSTAREAYYNRGEWLKWIGVEGISLLFFIFGNLGTRIIMFLGIVKGLKMIRKLDDLSILFAAVMFASAIIPTFLIQKGNPWNTIQFFYYLIYLSALLLGVIIYRLISNQFRAFKIIFISLFLVITPINAVTTFLSGFYDNPPARLSYAESDALKFISSQPDGVVLTYPYDKNNRDHFTNPYPLLVYDTTNYVAAFSGKPTFIEDTVQQDILQKDYQPRIVAENDFFQRSNYDWSKGFLKSNNIKYIYLPKLFGLNLNEDQLNIKKIYENKEVLVYEVI